MRYDALNEYIMPAMGVVVVLELPSFVYFGLPQNFLLYLLPTQGPLLLLQWAFAPLEGWKLAYGILGSAAFIVAGYVLARRAFHTFVTRRVGLSR